MQRKVERDMGGNIRYIFPRAGARMSAKTSPKKKEKTTVEVHKFGGASLSDGAAFRHAVTIVTGRPGPQAVVVSAPAGVTDRLLGLAARAATGDGNGTDEVSALRKRYREILKGLTARAAKAGEEAAAEIDRSFDEL